MVEGEIKEQGLARDWLKVRRKLDQIGLFSNKGRVEAEGFQPVAEWLQEGGSNEKVSYAITEPHLSKLISTA